MCICDFIEFSSGTVKYFCRFDRWISAVIEWWPRSADLRVGIIASTEFRHVGWWWWFSPFLRWPPNPGGYVYLWGYNYNYQVDPTGTSEDQDPAWYSLYILRVVGTLPPQIMDHLVVYLDGNFDPGVAHAYEPSSFVEWKKMLKRGVAHCLAHRHLRTLAYSKYYWGGGAPFFKSLFIFNAPVLRILQDLPPCLLLEQGKCWWKMVNESLCHQITEWCNWYQCCVFFLCICSPVLQLVFFCKSMYPSRFLLHLCDACPPYTSYCSSVLVLSHPYPKFSAHECVFG